MTRFRTPILVLLATLFSLGLAFVVHTILHSPALLTEGHLRFEVLSRSLELSEPRALYLLVILPWIVLGAGYSLTDMSRGQLILQTAGRVVLLLLISAGLSGPGVGSERQTLSLVALVDVSDSMTDKQLETARVRLSELRKLAKQRGDELHLVVFAGSPVVVPLLDQPELPVPVLRGPGAPVVVTDRDATDIQAALQLAYGLHSPGMLRRVLLFTDGNQTDGDLLAEAQAAKRRGIRLDHVALDKDQEEEVLVSGLRLVGGESAEAEMKVGAPFTLEAEIYASAPQRVRATLFLNGTKNPEDGHKDVDLSPGKNLVRFRGEVHQAGYASYKVQIGPIPQGGEEGTKGQALRDRFPSNNQALLSLSIKGRPRVLYIEGEPSAARYLSQALGRESIDVDTRNSYGLPSSAKELAKYDLVLLSDVSSTLISQGQMAAIEAYVRDLGGGFIMAGGENSFGSGGYQGTLLEKVLPVRFEQEKKRDQPSLALVLLIDRSGSMNGPKLELAKDAARATAELLAPDDLIGVVAFDSVANAQVPLQRAQNKVRISTNIQRLQAGGGTAFLPPLQEAYQQLISANAKIKHVIMLSDGQADRPGVLELVDRMVESRITISSVGVGTGADQGLLTEIAEHGNGRFYFTQDATSIPKIFTKETTQVARSALVEDVVKVVVQKRVELLDGTGIEAAPSLRGYVATKPKPLSEVILSSHLGEPLLVRWRLGLGQAVAFTSDVKNRWAVDWLRWPGYGRFFAQLIRSTMRHDPRTRGNGYDLRASAIGGRAHVVVDAVASDDRFVSGLKTTLEVISPAPGVAGGGVKIAGVEMAQTAPGRYEGDVQVGRVGTFLLRALHRTGEAGAVVAESWGSLSLSYSREYLALPSDQEFLLLSSKATSGKTIASAQEALDPGDEKVHFVRVLWPYLIGLALLLLLLDVALRRIRILGYRPLSL